jgi:hypothetical protein
MVGSTIGQGCGHDHFTRRQALGVMGGAAGALTAGGLGVLLGATPALAATPDRRPKPIPGGTEFGPVRYHFYAPDHVTPGDKSTPILEQSAITDFDGVVASAHLQGTGTGTDLTTGIDMPLVFDADMRVMQGTYVAMDGETYEDTFGFI